MTSAARSIAAKTLLLGLFPALIAAASAAMPQAPSPAPAAPPPAAAATAPTPLSAAASASPQVQPPAAPPQKLVLQAAAGASGSDGPRTARGQGKVARERPATFLFEPEAGRLFSISVASPQSAARISIFIGEATQPEAGTSQADGAIRWSTSLDGGARVKIVVHTAGAEIPFGVEVISGPGSV